MILFFRRKMKDDLSQKKRHGNMIFSSNAPKRLSFQKNCAGTWSFLYYLGRWYSFSAKYDIFSLDGKWKMIFLKKYMKIWYFCIYVWILKTWYSPEKIHVKVIDILDHILERVPTILCAFIETFMSVFIYFPAVKKA